MSSEIVLRLVPHVIDERTKTLVIEKEQWRQAVNLVYQRGYRPNVDSGLSRLAVPTFTKALSLALEEGLHVHPQLVALLAFLKGPGRLGFMMSRSNRRAC